MALQKHRTHIFCPPNPSDLFYDEACLTFKNALDVPVILYKRYDACDQCDFEFWTDIQPFNVTLLLVPIYTVTSFMYEDYERTLSSCVVQYHFEQHGLYHYVADFSCDFVHVINIPNNPYTSFFILNAVIGSLWVITMLLSYLKLKRRILRFIRKKLRRKSEEELKLAEEPELRASQIFHKIVYDEETNEDRVVEYVSRGVNTVEDLEELRSVRPGHVRRHLDFVEFEALLVFRGLVASLWVFMNLESNTYPLFTKSAWHGLTLQDVTVGWFYWVLAASFYLRLNYNMRKYGSRRRLIYRTVLLRSLLYIVGGLCYNTINETVDQWHRSIDQLPTIRNTRLFGHFQRVGLSYLIVGSLEACFVKPVVKKGFLPCMQDIKDSLPQWLGAVTLVAVHTSITYLLPVPGCPTGYVGPGGRHDHANHPGCIGGAARYIDNLVVNSDNMQDPLRLWEGYDIYAPIVRYDPQGLLGTLTTGFLMTLAMQASRTFIYIQDRHMRMYRMLVSAFWQLLLGGLLCSFNTRGGLIPVNSHLMSVTYVLVVSGLAYFVLALIYLINSIARVIPDLHSVPGFPLIYVGVNFLFVIVGCQVLKHSLPFSWHIPEERMHNNHEFLVRGLWCVVVWIVCCHHLLINQMIFPL